jgi:hypothetical protein
VMNEEEDTKNLKKQQHNKAPTTSNKYCAK